MGTHWCWRVVCDESLAVMGVVGVGEFVAGEAVLFGRWNGYMRWIRRDLGMVYVVDSVMGG